ncbi:MAG TPA: serine hydrolase domain-containing protein [Acidobacteriaceae bacterium]|jgi:CubicO group peptidase (beta-lactamase class C family)
MRPAILLLAAGSLLLGILPAKASAQTTNTLGAATTAQVNDAVEKVIADTGIPSASVALVEHGEIVYLHAYGKARLEPPTAATTDMQYSIGSVSKQFAAALILMLVEDGKMTLDDPIGKYLPHLTRANEVTVRELLSMTAGYEDFWPEDYVMTTMMVPTTAQHILDVWGKKPLDFDPGTQWQYSNTNYVIAGRIAEIVGGKPLVEQLRERIFTPLHMAGVRDQDANHLPPSDPTGYYQHALGPLRPAPLEGTGWMFAAGELAMSPHDLALWNISLLNRSLLKPASYDAMFTNVKLKDGKLTDYGLGVQVGEQDGWPVISHSGEISGFVSQNTVYPDARAAVTVLTNIDASSAAAAIARALRPIVLSASTNSTPTNGMQAAEGRALKIFTGLQNGQLDRSQLTDLCNNYFTQEAIEDFATSLKPLGAPQSFAQIAAEPRGGMTFRAFRAQFPNRRLTVTTYEEPDGKLEQYLVLPAGN